MSNEASPRDKRYNFERIRTLFIEGFSDEDLRDLCFDVPDFRPVYHQLAQTTGKTEIVRRLLAHAAQRAQLDLLLALAKERNPAQYTAREPYFLVVTHEQSAEFPDERDADLFLAENQFKLINSADTPSEIVAFTTERSHIEARRDVRFIGKETTHITERPLTAVEEDRQAADFALKDLAEGVKKYVQTLKTVVAETPESREPYRGLLDYDLRHTHLFFGRNQDVERLLQHLIRHHLTVLHAASGAGKSSLLKAGIAPRLIAAGHMPIYARPNQNPALTLKRTLLPTVDQIPKLLNITLRSFFWQVYRTGSLEKNTKIYILLDQFEEYFTELDRPTQTEFLRQLVECLDDGQLNVYWVLSLRKEYLSDLATLKSYLKNPLGNEYRLNFLSVEEARAVITQPALRYGVTFADELTERLLDDLAETGFYPPHIQLVCHTLYQTRSEHQSEITLALYEAQGKAVGILKNYLDRILKSLPPDEQLMGRRLLEFLINSENRRIARTIPELTAEFGASQQQNLMLDNILALMINSHLLRRTEVNEDDQIVPAYELAHDYLIEKVNFDPAVKARKAVKEMLAEEVRDYHRHGTLLSRDKMEFIENRLEPAELQPEAKELILCSALALDYNIDFWWQLALPEIRNRVLAKALRHKAASTRQRAAVLAAISNEASLVEILAGLIETDPDLAVRQRAALSLAKMDHTRFVEQLEHLCGSAPTYPKQSLELMAYVQNEQPNLLDLRELSKSDWLTIWRMRWLRVNNNWPQIGFTTLYAALGAGLGAAVGGFIGSWGLTDIGLLIFFAFVYGLAVGSSVGFGYGLAAAMDKHLGLVGYSISAAICSAIAIVLFNLSGEPRRFVDIPFGLAVGGLSGISAAVITKTTQRYINNNRQRQIARLGLCLLPGSILGVILVWADYLSVFPTTPDHPAYGFTIGLFLIPGLVVIGLGGWNKN